MIRVTFNGPLKRPWPQLSKSVETPEGVTIRSFLQSLDYSDTDIQLLRLMVNKTQTSPEATLNNDDDLEVFLMVGGG